MRQIPCSPKRTRRLAVNDSIVDQRYLKEEHFTLESWSIITYGNLRYDDSSLACFRHSDRDVWREATVFPVHHPCLRHPHNLKAWNRRFPAIYVCARGVGGFGGWVGNGYLECQQNHWQVSFFKFWIHLENQPPDSIAKLCLNISDKTAEENKSGVINKMNLLCTQLNINKQSVNFKNPTTFLSKAVNNLSKLLKNHQLNLIRTNKKLKFYSIFKNETNYSEFIIHIRNPEHRRVASKFRIYRV